MHHAVLPTSEIGVGPAVRFAVDLADPGHAQVGLAGGQSGLPGSRNYDDRLRDWLAGSSWTLWMHGPDVEYHRVGTWQLRAPGER